ncbi:MAG: biotin synthase BioB [Deltaproteobacteria bacterium]|nr:biotin synthase BioB [Deltaproteobacteria bacterium]
MSLNRAEVESWLELPCRELMARALAVKLSRRGESISLCSIINAKSGQCSEDCRFCTQSAHYKTDTPVYPLKAADEIVAAARQAKTDGASHFSLVSSGREITPRLLAEITGIITAIREAVDIRVCASLGMASLRDLQLLQRAGLSRYHHNLETSRRFFPRVVTTHGFDDRVRTIEAAHDAGLEVCAGGIIGLGESEADRVSLALTLEELRVDSVPLNILIPLPGTPMQDVKPLGIHEILRAISLFRLILPGVPLRLAAGRESALRDFMSSAFMAGADGMMIGGYLTQRGRSATEDQQFVAAIKNLWA